MQSIIDHLANDPNIDPALRRILESPIHIPGSERQQEVRDEEGRDQWEEERLERIERGD